MSDVILFITLMSLGGIFLILAIIVNRPNDDLLNSVFGWIGSLFWLYLFILGMCGVFDKKPTAIDVYNGKTTLEITYRDNVPVDTVVVYKKK